MLIFRTLNHTINRYIFEERLRIGDLWKYFGVDIQDRELSGLDQ